MCRSSHPRVGVMQATQNRHADNGVFDDPNRIHLSIKNTYSSKTQASKTSGGPARFTCLRFRRICVFDREMDPVRIIKNTVVSMPILGGLHHTYSRVA